MPEPTGKNFDDTEPEFVAALRILDYLNFDTSMASVRDDAAEIASIITELIPVPHGAVDALVEALTLCQKALLVLPEDALGRDSGGWFYRDELLAQVNKLIEKPTEKGTNHE